MHIPEILISLLIIISGVAVFAERINISYPIAFLLSGTLLALIPSVPHITIKPNLILVLFLPPLLMQAAFLTSLRDFTLNLRPILSLAIGLVIATSACTAGLLVYLIPGMTWAVGFVVGAIISPPDAVAATSAFKSVRLPKRLVSIIEGESLVNDAAGLVIYKFAVAAVVTSSFSWAATAGEFCWMVISGLAIGSLLGTAYMRLFPYLREETAEIITTFITPYAAYLIAESLHGSGVLAVVVAGLVVSWYAPEKFPPRFRIPTAAIWKLVVFILNGIIFLFIGLQLPKVLRALSIYDPKYLALYAISVCLAVVLVRFIWVYAFSYGVRHFMPSVRKENPYHSWQNVFVLSWTSMRGVVSLATALALPLTIESGQLFPYRNFIIFIAVCVIFFTLVIQGLTLPWITRKLKLTYDPRIIYEDWHARVNAAQNVLTKIDELGDDPTTHIPALERIRSHYEDRLISLGDGPNTPLFHAEQPTTKQHPLIQAEYRIWQEIIAIERSSVIEMRKNFTVNDEVMNAILRELDHLAHRIHLTSS